MNVQEHIKGTRSFGNIVPIIKCRDGFSIGVQAGQGLYSEPNFGSGPFTHVECGFPSEDCPELEEYAENPDDHENTVFYYVPIELVQQLIDRHNSPISVSPEVEKTNPDHSPTISAESAIRRIQTILSLDMDPSTRLQIVTRLANRTQL